MSRNKNAMARYLALDRCFSRGWRRRFYIEDLVEECSRTLLDSTGSATGISRRQVLDDIYEEVDWAYLAKNYFGKSRSWLYHKFSGRNGAQQADFSDVDRDRLRAALKDIAARVGAAADRL